MRIKNQPDCPAMFGAFIKAAREKQGLYQRNVADELGVTQAYYSQIENGLRDVDLELAISICKILKLDILDFVKKYI